MDAVYQTHGVVNIMDANADGDDLLLNGTQKSLRDLRRAHRHPGHHHQRAEGRRYAQDRRVHLAGRHGLRGQGGLYPGRGDKALREVPAV